MKQISEVEKKTVHVFFKSLSRSLLQKREGTGFSTPTPFSLHHHNPIFPADPGIFRLKMTYPLFSPSAFL
jgi:hypothetical protein